MKNYILRLLFPVYYAWIEIEEETDYRPDFTDVDIKHKQMDTSKVTRIEVIDHETVPTTVRVFAKLPLQILEIKHKC